MRQCINDNITYHCTVDNIQNIKSIGCCSFNMTTKDDCSCIVYCFHSKGSIRWHTLSNNLRYDPLT